MAGDMSFEWDGGQSPAALEAKLEAFESALDQRLYEAMETLVLMVESSARQNAPVDSGRLRSSISSQVSRTAASVIEGEIGSNVEYAPYQEFGTSEMGAQPYLRPAFAAHQSDFRRLVEEAVEDAARDAGLA